MAYDCIDWDFQWFILYKMGFGERQIRWIKRCVSCTRVLVLVNGSADREFMMERGLRQGPPLSPLLFNIVVESLSILVNQFEEN